MFDGVTADLRRVGMPSRHEDTDSSNYANAAAL